MTVRILLLDPSGPEAGALIAAAESRGYQVHGVLSRHGPHTSPCPPALASRLPVDFTQPDCALHEVVDHARLIRADAALTTNEYLTPLLATVCAALGLPGNDLSRAIAARNKILMQEAFRRSRVATPRSLVIHNPEHALQRLTTLGWPFPCVVKPAATAGSAGVTVVHNGENLAAAWADARTARPMHGLLADPRVLLQEHLDGAEYSVESLTQDGRTTHLCITRKLVTSGPHRVEIGHSLPTRLPITTERAILEQAERAITAVGIRNGASHTEVIVRPDAGCSVIEIGARIGAGRIGLLLQHALGIDPWSALLDIALGRPADLTPTRRGYATIRFITSSHTGLFRGADGLPTRGPHVPEVQLRARPGAAVREARRNSDRIGHFIVTGTSPAAVERYAQRLHAAVTVDVQPAPAATPSPDPVPVRKR